jgi:hypothetical protein
VLRSDYRNFVELLAPGAQPWQPRDPEPLPDSDFDPTESGVPWRTMPIKPAIRRVYQGAVVPEGGEAREVPGNERFRARLHHGGK